MIASPQIKYGSSSKPVRNTILHPERHGHRLEIREAPTARSGTSLLQECEGLRQGQEGVQGTQDCQGNLRVQRVRR